MSEHKKIWWTYNTVRDTEGFPKQVRQWYWTDAKAEEAMGPFDSYLEALVDYCQVRLFDMRW